MEIFSKRLKEARALRGVTQYELATYLNLDRATIAGYETKGREPDFHTVVRIADILNVSVDYLLGREG